MGMYCFINKIESVKVGISELKLYLFPFFIPIRFILSFFFFFIKLLCCCLVRELMHISFLLQNTQQ